MTPQEKTIASLIEPVVAAEGFDLVRLRVTGSGSPTLQVMAERPDKTMSAEDCALLSRALSPVLEAADPIAGRYTLEVSSPGIDRPLTRLSDFDDWRGYEAKIELDRLIEGRRRLRGVLAGVEDDNVLFDMEGEEETALVPFAWISAAKLLLTDALEISPMSAESDRAMICGNPNMLVDLRKLLEGQGFTEGSSGTPGDYVVEKAFAER